MHSGKKIKPLCCSSLMLKQTICLDMRADLSRKQNRSHDFFRDARSIALRSSYMQIRAKLFVLNNTLVPEDFLDFSPHERAAREPRSASLLSHAVKTQENPLGPGYLNETPQNIYKYIWIDTSHPPPHGLYAT